MAKITSYGSVDGQSSGLHKTSASTTKIVYEGTYEVHEYHGIFSADGRYGTVTAIDVLARSSFFGDFQPWLRFDGSWDWSSLSRADDTYGFLVERSDLFVGSSLRDNLRLGNGDDVARGSDGDDVFAGEQGHDLLLGERGNDHLIGGAGDDVLCGGAGNDEIEGGPGVDTALYSKPASNVGGSEVPATSDPVYSRQQCVITGNPSTALTVTTEHGIDTLTEVEHLAFVDGTLSFVSHDHLAQCYRLYFATLGRQPDALGLNYQAARLDGGASLADVAAGFVNSPEFQAIYGTLSNAQFVDLLYDNVLDRSANQGEIAYHVGRLSWGASRSDIVVGFSESPEHVQKHIGAVEAGMWDIDEGVASISRLYFGVLERTPETSGLAYYKGVLAGGASLSTLANGFAQSPEFIDRYGTLDDQAFVNQLYRSILDRSATSGEIDFHVARLGAGSTRGDIALGFTESPEYQELTLPLYEHGVHVSDADFVL